MLDAFMKIEGPNLAGESTDQEFTGEIELFSFDQTIVRGATAGKAGTSDVQRGAGELKPMTIVKPLDLTSPKLLQAAAAGTVYDKLTLSVCQPSGTSKEQSDRWQKKPYLVIVLQKVHITRMHLTGDPALHFFGRQNSFPFAKDIMECGPLEEIDWAFKKIAWAYKGGTAQKNITGTWNLETNRPT